VLAGPYQCEHGQREAGGFGIEQRYAAANYAGLLERPHPPPDRRLRQRRPLGEIVHRQAGIRLQQTQQLAVLGVHSF